jgi:2-keto-4-pentenoate hydratase/2-oxohepta-3-ene-1,7-dioic acid hydratase in catechol pathway
MTMQWARIRTADGRTLVGVIEEDSLHPRAALGSEQPAGAPVPLEGTTLLPPCVPGKFIGLWNNFHAAAQRNGWEVPTHPLYFLKPSTALAGDGATVEIPAASSRVIFEGELGVVIGRRCRNASPEEAADAILGYTCVNDFTALDLLDADSSFRHWTRAKGFDGFGVVGPVIATGLDWRALTVRVLVGGRERQSYPADDMIMGPAEIVSRLSADMTLDPGDLIACGTSVGARPVKAGDEVAVVIDGIGSVTVTMAPATGGTQGA